MTTGLPGREARRDTWLRCLGLLGVIWAGSATAQVAVVDVTLAPAADESAGGRRVLLENPTTGYHAESVSTADGRARFSAVPAAAGYAVLVDGERLATDIQLRANESRSVAVALLQAVVVSARRRPFEINGLDAEVSAGLSGRQLEALPVEARDLTRALVRLPNVTPSTGFFPEAPAISINGANGLFAQYLIDGVDNNENFLGGPKFPISTGFARDVTVLASSYTVAYGRTGNGVVNVTSKSGSNNWSGEAFYLSRPGQPLDAGSPYPSRDLSGNAVKDGFQRDQGGFSIGGPLARDRTFLYANVEYTRDRKDNRLTSPELGVDTIVPGENTALLASLKIDHRFNDEWRLSLRANHGDVAIERQGGGLEGGVTFPSAGSAQDRVSTLVAASVVRDGPITSESTLAYSRFRWNYGRPLGQDGPQVTVESPDGLPAAILGDPGFVFDDLERSWQLQQRFSGNSGNHAWSVGADLLHSDFELAGGGNERGNYRVRLTEDELEAVRALGRGGALDVNDIPVTTEVIDYSVELRPATFGRAQKQAALYLQDQLSLSPDLTVTAGLRWDYDSLSKGGASAADLDNIAPRIALNYRLRDDLAIRAGAGLYYERLPYAVLSDALQQNNVTPAFRDQIQELVAAGLLPESTRLERVTFEGNLSVNPDCPLGYLRCPTPENAADLRETALSNERRILNPRGLDSPYTVQWSAGLQWQLTDQLIASADLILARGHHQLRLRDLNAPAPFTPDAAALTDANIALLRSLPSNAERRALAESLGLIRSPAAADATRPVAPRAGGARQIVVSETEGESRYKALNVVLRRQADPDRYGYLLSYTLSKLSNNTDDINFRASNSNEFGAEWGPSINDRRHVISTVLYWYPVDSLTVTLAGLFQSGQPVNLIPDASIFGTTDLNGDGAAFSDAYLGNSDRAPGSARNSGRLPWSETVDLGLRYAPRWGPGRVELSVDVFNLFNQRNLSGFANSATQSNQIQVFGQPFERRNSAAPRQYQFGVRYFFAP